MSEPARVLSIVDVLPAESRAAADVVLGPASVVDVQGPMVQVLVAGEEEPRPARPALAVPYRPAVGDEVLVLGRGASLFVVGVLAGTGATAIEVPGDLTFRAVGGTLRLEGDRRVDVRSDELRLEARSIGIAAGKVVQKMDALYQRVRGLWSTHVETMHTTVEANATTTARSSTLVVEETASVNGKQIHLG